MKVPKEFVLMGTSNDGVRHRYSVEKNEGFKKSFVKFMRDLGFDSKKIAGNFTYIDKKGEEKELKIKDINDACWYYQNDKYELDVFFGNKRIILVIRTNQKVKRVRRKKLIKEIRKNSKWKKLPKAIVKRKRARRGNAAELVQRQV